MERIKNNWEKPVLILIFIIVAGMYIYLGDNIVITKDKILDFYVPQYQILKDTGTFFDYDASVPILGNISRSYLPSSISVMSFLFCVFPAYIALELCYIVKLLLSFIGTRMLVTEYLGDKSTKYKGLSLLLCVLYGLINIYPYITLSFACIPILLYYLSKFDCKIIKSYIPLIVCCLFIDFIHVGIYLISVMALVFIIYNKKHLNNYIGLVIIFLSDMLLNITEIVDVFFNSQVINTSDGNKYEFLDSFIYCGTGSIGIQIIIVPVVIILLVRGIIHCGIKNHLQEILILADILFNSIIMCLLDKLSILRNLEILDMRYINLFLWFYLFSCCLFRIYDFKIGKITGILCCLAGVILIVFSNGTYNDYYKNLSNLFFDGNYMTYKEYYSEELFKQIKEDIEYDKEWSIAYGFEPAVLNYNGISTIDGYDDCYNNIYYEEFEKIIAPTLDNSELISKLHTENKNACYVYADDEVNSLDIDMKAFKDWGGRYVFSAVEISNYNELGLILVDNYESNDGIYNIYLYKTESYYNNKNHSQIKFSQRKITLDDRNYGKILEKMENMLEEANAIKEENDKKLDGEILVQIGKTEEFEQMLEEANKYVDDLETAYCIDTIEFNRNINNEEIIDEKDELYEEYLEASDDLMAMYREISKSPYKEILLKKYNSGLVDSINDYEDMTEEKKETNIECENLVNEYKIEVAKNSNEKKTAEIYKKLVELHDKEAIDEGYDNYLEYSYDCLYIRDYSVEDIKELCKIIKKKCQYYVAEAFSYANDISQYDPGYITEDDKATFNMLYKYVGKVDEELELSMKYLLDNELYDLKWKNNKAQIGMTTSLKSYGDGYIIDMPIKDSLDLFTYIHEFGHFNETFYQDEDRIISYSNVDTSEIHSQGLELLIASQYKDMYGKETGTYLEISDVVNMINSIYSACMYTEFEIYSFEHPKASIEELAEEFYDLKSEYGYDNNSENGESYDWVYVNHFFECPCYYVSYATSALAALELYEMSYEDYERACDKYMRISALSSAWCFKETLDYVGMEDVLEADNTVLIFKSTLDIIEAAYNNLMDYYPTEFNIKNS